MSAAPLASTAEPSVCDLVLTELDKVFVVRSVSAAGQRVIDRLSLADASVEQAGDARRRVEKAAESMGRTVDVTDVRGLLQSNQEHPRWDDVADRMIEMITGAMRELALGDPRDPATQVGPVIDAEAKDRLDRWIAGMAGQGRLLARWDEGRALPPRGLYVAPAMIALDRAGDLREEVFGPILHVVRWRASELDALLDYIASNGTGLTLGIQTRIDGTVARVVARLGSGNVYVNRSMIGAVVGTQPFGGSELSGTGPKAGGPNYLHRLVIEQVVTVNTAAAGGNASLLMDDAG